MYRMMWDYFFPEEEQDSQRRQVSFVLIEYSLFDVEDSSINNLWLFSFKIWGKKEVWKVSTTAGSRRPRKNFTGPEAASTSQSTREAEVPGRLSATTLTSGNTGSSVAGSHADTSQVFLLELFIQVYLLWIVLPHLLSTLRIVCMPNQLAIDTVEVLETSPLYMYCKIVGLDINFSNWGLFAGI